MSVKSNILTLRKHIPEHVELVCVSKFHPNEAIIEAYSAGERIFGESKVQELCSKFDLLPKDIHWHLIGHLQTNKIKYIVPFITLIHSVDSFKLLSEINKNAAKINRKVNCLLQVHIATEDTKFGFSEEEIIEMLDSELFKNMENVLVCGLMGMATLTEDINQIRKEFKSLKVLFDKIKSVYFIDNNDFKTISMGMSDDFETAIEEGSTMVRVGSAIFGYRNYNS